MARPSKLTEVQWEKIGNRLLAGESAASLAREFQVSKSVISARFSKRLETVRNTAGLIVEADNALAKLNITEQHSAFNLANELMAISTHVSQGARYGAMTFHRLAGVANQHAQTLDDANPDEESLLTIAKLTKTANEAVSPALNLLSANKAAVEKMGTVQEDALVDLLSSI